jgi:hypothetical protein
VTDGAHGAAVLPLDFGRATGDDGAAMLEETPWRSERSSGGGLNNDETGGADDGPPMSKSASGCSDI